MKVKSESEVDHSCLSFRDPMDYSPPGSPAHGIFQARVLEWGAIAAWRFPKRLKIELPYYSTPGHIPQENCNSKRYMLPNVHCNTIYNSQYMEATCMSINRGMDKDDVVHIYDGILLSQKEERNCAICGDVGGPRDCHTQ